MLHPGLRHLPVRSTARKGGNYAGTPFPAKHAFARRAGDNSKDDTWVQGEYDRNQKFLDLVTTTGWANRDSTEREPTSPRGAYLSIGNVPQGETKLAQFPKRATKRVLLASSGPKRQILRAKRTAGYPKTPNPLTGVLRGPEPVNRPSSPII